MSGSITGSDRLAAWDERVRWLIVVAALAPFALALVPLDPDSPLILIVDLGSWGVFVVDLVVRLSLDRGYLRTGAGKFDLGIVLFTFPWYVLPGVDGTQFLAVFRTARLLRLVSATGGARRLRYLYDKMGSLLLAAVVVLLVASLVVVQAEPPESGFDTFGDAIWWALVTLTTVGYGDYFPVTGAGRLVGFLVMLLGLAVLGTLAGVLASMFGGGAEEPEEAVPAPEPDRGPPDGIDQRLARLEQDVAAIRRAIEIRSGPA